MRSSRLKCLPHVTLIALVLAVAAAGASAAQAATPATIVNTNHAIHGIATSSSSLVWRQDRGGAQRHCNTWVRRRSWVTRAVSDVHKCGIPGSAQSYRGWFGDLAMGTRTVAYTTIYYEFDCCLDWIDMALTTPGLGVRATAHHTLECRGDEIRHLVARAGLAAYIPAEWTVDDPASICGQGGIDTPGNTLTGGPVNTVSLTNRSAPLPLVGSPPAAFIGLSAKLIAMVPYDLAAATSNRYPPPLPQIQIWSLTSRSPVRTIAETGVIKALDMAGDRIAVLAGDGSGHLRIDTFSALTGDAIGSTAVAAGTAPMVAAYYRFVAYVVGTRVMALDTDTGKSHIVAQPAYRPREILAVRGQAVWYSSGLTWGRVLSAPLG